MLSCFTNPGTNTNSDSSPEERPEPGNIKLNTEEFEKLDIQPFEKSSKNDLTPKIFELNDQILERSNEELEEKCEGTTQKFDEERSPEIKIRKNMNINMNVTLTEPNGGEKSNEDNEDFIGEIIKRHRYTFSKRMVDSKREKPEDLEKKYMSAMGKSIVALNYKSKISRNPMKKFSTFYPSLEETKEDNGTQYSPTNKITLIPINKCFKMGSMQEINFEKQSSSMNSGNLSEKHQIVSNINIGSVAEEINASIQEQPSFFTESRKEKVGDKLFEDILIIGVDKMDISSAISSENQKNLTITPKILYSFRPESESNEIEFIIFLVFIEILLVLMNFLSSIRKILPDYCFPFRLNVEKIDVGSSMSYTSVLMVMYPSVNIFEGRDKCFITTLSCEETYKNHQDDGSFLHKINPNRVLHCICLKTTDYIETVIFL